MSIKINKYWILNLWEAIDGETVEINFDVSAYLNLDIAKEQDLEIIIEDLLYPALIRFKPENQEKIKCSLLYCSKYLPESDLVGLLNFFGGTVFSSPSPAITCKHFYAKVYERLFHSPCVSAFEEVSDKENYRLD